MQTDPPLGEPVPDWTPPPLPEHAALDGRYVRLEPLTIEHAAPLFDQFGQDLDGAVWTYMPVGPFRSLATYHRWIREIVPSTDPLFFAIRNLETGRYEGTLSLLRMNPGAGSIEVGYIAFSPVLQNTRAGTEAIVLTAREAFRLGYRRFEWKCNALNYASRKAAQRYGFSYEGVFRQAAVYKGRNRDTAWFAMIDKEYPALEAAWEKWLEPENFVSTGTQIRSLSNLTRPILAARDPMLP